MGGRRPSGDARIVYSTDGGAARPSPHNRKIEVPRPAAQAAAGIPSGIPEDGIVRLHRDRKGRGGKSAVAITGLPGSEADLDALLKRLKQALGTGGAREGRMLLIQGDQRERIQAELERLGHRVKLAGG